MRQLTDGQTVTGNPARSSGGAAVSGPAGDRAASDARTAGATGTYALANRLSDGSPGGKADSPRRSGRGAYDGGTTPGGGREAGLAGRKYVRARFGDVSVLIAPELAAQIRAAGKEQP